MNIGKNDCGKTIIHSIVLIEENILLTLSLGPQSYTDVKGVPDHYRSINKNVACFFEIANNSLLIL